MNLELDPNFKDFLIDKIPIMKDEQLLKLLLEYCNISNDLISLNTSGSPSSKGTTSIISSLKDNKIKEINTELKRIKKKYTNHIKYLNRTNTGKKNENKNENENKNKNENKNENENSPKILNVINSESKNILKKIKSHKIEAKSLIEAIINCTLNFYELQLQNNNKKIVNSSMSIVSNRMYHIMNNLKGEGLGKFIIRIYYSDLPNKNKYLLYLLKKIANILLNLQNQCGFIHGDFHSGNIIIIPKDGIYKNQLININDLENNNYNYKIVFIDFGNSSIKLPLNNSNYLILSTPSRENIKRKNLLDLNTYPNLKGIDLFHLIQNLDSIEKSEFTFGDNKIDENFNLFKNFIIKLKTMYRFSSSNTFKNMYDFTRSNNFTLQNNSILYPQNFKDLNINNIESIIIPEKINTQKNYQKKNLNIPTISFMNNNNILDNEKMINSNNNRERLIKPKKFWNNNSDSNNISILDHEKLINPNNSKENSKKPKKLWENNNNNRNNSPSKKLKT